MENILINDSKKSYNNATMLIQNEFEQQVKLVVDISKEIELSNDELLSDCIKSTNISKNHKNQIEEHFKDIKLILYATAEFNIEKVYEKMHYEISTLDITKKEISDYEEFLSTQKKIAYSLEVLESIKNIGLLINDNFMRRQQSNEYSLTIFKDMREKSLKLSNAILIYELTHFIVGVVENFNFLGYEDLLTIADEKLERIDQLMQKEKDLVEKIKSDPSMDNTTKKNTALRIKERLLGFQEKKKKWNNVKNKIIKRNQYVELVKEKSNSIKIIRDDARNHINYLESMGIVDSFERIGDIFSNFEFFKEIGSPVLSLNEMQELLSLE